MIKVNAHILNYLSSDANINVIATLEDNFKNSYELEFDFNNSNRSDDEEEKVVGTLPAGYYHPVMSL